MGDYDWVREFLTMIEERFGKLAANIFLGFAYLIVPGSVVHFGLDWFVSPFFEWVSKWTQGQPLITRENALPVVITVVFVAISTCVVVVGVMFYRRLRRRVLPQSVIDGLSALRSDGITIMNENSDVHSVTDLQTWRERWRAWREQVIAILGSSLTRTELLMFTRLGFFATSGPPYPVVNSDHRTWQQNMVRELEILESLIAVHQSRH